ncbi:MAG: hypothetical protein U1F52_05660 [Burkholderiales bacterium]
MRLPRTTRRTLATLCTVAAALTAGIGAPLAADIPATGVYDIRGGKVDLGTYRGWLTYHIACHSCHGRDALTIGLAPDLTQSIRTMSRQAFASKVLARYRVNLGLTESLFSETVRASVLAGAAPPEGSADTLPAMPAWQADAVVSARVLDLYAYLKARSDGALGPGRPAAAAR